MIIVKSQKHVNYNLKKFETLFFSWNKHFKLKQVPLTMRTSNDQIVFMIERDQELLSTNKRRNIKNFGHVI